VKELLVYVCQSCRKKSKSGNWLWSTSLT